MMWPVTQMSSDLKSFSEERLGTDGDEAVAGYDCETKAVHRGLAQAEAGRLSGAEGKNQQKESLENKHNFQLNTVV